MAETTRYRIGPLTSYTDADELRARFARAKPGEVLRYAIGPALGKDGATLRLVRSLVDSGAAAPCPQVRAPASLGFIYSIRKNSPGTGGGSGAAASPCAAAPGSPEHRLLEVLRDYASPGMPPVPSNAELAELAELPDAEAARYRLRKLADAGLVRVTVLGTTRRVQLTAKGRGA